MHTHQTTAATIANPEFGVCILGWGATGAGCALDAQLRGLNTVLLEANSFAAGTCSVSTRLIHGGVRYLEQVVRDLDLTEYRVVRRTCLACIRMIHYGPLLEPQQGIYRALL